MTRAWQDKIPVYNWAGPTNGGLDNTPYIEQESGAYYIHVLDTGDLGKVLLALGERFDVMLQEKNSQFILWLDYKGKRFSQR